MPNHITTQIMASSRVLASLIANENGDVDFNKLIPQPENIERGGCTGQHAEGVVCWLDWRREHWGTKWNAYSAALFDDHVRFDTAWSMPAPVIDALVAAHPTERIEVEWADEDLGSNCGRLVFDRGELVEDWIPEYGDESLDYAAHLKYGKSYAEMLEEWGK